MNAMTYRENFVSTAPLAPAASEPAAAPFQRPGPEVLSETIPVVFIGRNRDGFWVARDSDAKFGGLFWRKRAALDFARKSAEANATAGGCAIVFPQGRFELDTPNHGNPLIAFLMAARRALPHRVQRLIAVTRKRLAL
jgi:hypothetical protein